MIFNRDMIYLSESYNIKLTDNVLIKLEDAVRAKKDLLVTIDASHYGFRNGNWTTYRHDTVKHDIPSFVAPRPKPIIEQHRPDSSEQFGSVIAADYKLTKFHDQIVGHRSLDGCSSEEYMDFMRDDVLPVQYSNPEYNGLAYVEVVGKINHQDGIKKVLNREFLTVSIGAVPRRLVCSECLKDQVQGICSHYGSKSNRVFMLAESLEYEELSFVRKPADRFGRITRIHDGIMKETVFETDDTPRTTSVDVMQLQDFFKETEGKTIVCMNNICSVINNKEDEGMAKKSDETKISVSLADEFTPDAVTTLIDTMAGVEGALELADDLTDRQFAIVQKTDDGLKRRFPLCDELNVRVGLSLLDQASDLTDIEREKVKTNLEKSAKKLNIDLADFVKAEVTEEPVVAEVLADTEEAPAVVAPSKEEAINTLIDALAGELKAFEFPEVEEITLEDKEKAVKLAEKAEVENPITRLFSVLKGLAIDFKYAGAMLEGQINSYLMDAGKTAVAKGHCDSLEATATELQDQVKELEDEVTQLDTTNRELNYQIRGTLIDEVVASRDALGLIEDSVETEKTKLGKLNYEALVVMVSDCRKLKVKLNDTAVNNKVEIKTVQDPTLTDSASETEAMLTDEQHEEEKPLSFEAKVRLMKSLLRKTPRY